MKKSRKKAEKKTNSNRKIARIIDFADSPLDLHEISVRKIKNRRTYRNIELCKQYSHLYVSKKNRNQLWKIMSSDFESIWMSKKKRDSQSETIHFELKREMSTNTITLSNETTTKSQKSFDK